MIEQEWNIKFAQKLRKLLYRRGMTQKDLSLVTGISEHTISKYRRAQGKPSVGNIIKISKALDCSIEDLFEK